MRFLKILLSCVAIYTTLHAHAEPASYQVNPGDVLLVFVWNEKDLTQEVLVRPDGTISIPLAGQVAAGGLSVVEIEKNLTDALTKYMKDKPSVTVAIKETKGYNIYVLGKVNRPGQFPIVQPTDVMQALAMAGGLNTFAAESGINVLRRAKDGSQKAIRFRYNDVKSGDELQTNILLQSGDIVVVP
jgi:polysaccharide export outer membrane protein